MALVAKHVVAQIELQEKRTAAQISLKLTDSDLERVNRIRRCGSFDFVPLGTIAYGIFREGLTLMEERLRLSGSQKKHGAK